MKSRSQYLYIEPEIDDVPIPHDIGFPFQANGSLFSCLGMGAGGHQVIIGDHFGPDKSLFYVRMDYLGGILTTTGFPMQPAFRWGNGVLFMALNIEAFQPLSDFLAEGEVLANAMKSTPPQRGFAEVLLPGEPDAQRFEQIAAFLARCFRVMPLPDAIDALQRGCLPAAAACITFDDGYADNLEVAAPILRKHGLSATFFIATGFTGGGRMFNDTVIEAGAVVDRCIIDKQVVIGAGARVGEGDDNIPNVALPEVLNALAILLAETR